MTPNPAPLVGIDETLRIAQEIVDRAHESVRVIRTVVDASRRIVEETRGAIATADERISAIALGVARISDAHSPA